MSVSGFVAIKAKPINCGDSLRTQTSITATADTQVIGAVVMKP